MLATEMRKLRVDERSVATFHVLPGDAPGDFRMLTWLLEGFGRNRCRFDHVYRRSSSDNTDFSQRIEASQEFTNDSHLLAIAGSIEKELARQVSYLKTENQILRSRFPDRISLTEREKNRLIRFAKNLGSALNELATIVHPGTIRRWIREAAAKTAALQKGKTGHPRTAARRRTGQGNRH